MNPESTSYILTSSESILPKLLQTVPFWAFWFLIGWLIGVLLNRFVARIALWLGITVLVTILLISLGFVNINASSISNFFNVISNWLPKVGSSIRNNAFVRTDGLAMVFFILGVALSTYRAKSDANQDEIPE